MTHDKKLELVGQIEGVLNDMCFERVADCHNCPCTEVNGHCKLQKAIDNLHLLLEPES